MDNKRMIIGGVILVITAVFIWYVYTNYISTKKNYEKIYNKYYNKKFMMDNKNSSIVSRQMIADLLPATKYKLKFCDNKDAISDSTINTLFKAFIIVLQSKYSEDFDKYELGTLRLIYDWPMKTSTVDRVLSFTDEQKIKPENKGIIEHVEKILSQDKFALLDEMENNRKASIEYEKNSNNYLSKEDALKKIREIEGLC
jgi:hypothetical protein